MSPSPAPAATAHCHSGRSKTVDPRRKHSRRRENDTAFVNLPDHLYAELKSRDLPASELLQIAVRAEIDRRDAIDAVEQYVAELAAEVGQPSARDRARARGIFRRVQDRRLNEAG